MHVSVGICLALAIVYNAANAVQLCIAGCMRNCMCTKKLDLLLHDTKFC